MSEFISTYPYPPRPGSNLDQCAPDASEVRPLQGELLDEVINFENNLFAISLDPEAFPTAEEYRRKQEGQGRPLQSSDKICNKKLYPKELGVQYFLSPEGREHIETVFDLPAGVDTVDSMRMYLSRLDIRTTPSKQLNTLQAKSVEYEVNQLKRDFIDNDYKGETLGFPDIVTVYKNPALILEKAQQYRDLKMYLKHVKADLLHSEAGEGHATNSKLMLVDMYRHRINEFLVDTYVSAYKFLGQYHASGHTIHQDLVATMERELPGFFAHEDIDAKAMFLQRMDRFKHGVDVDDNGDFIWKSAEAARLVELAEQGEFEAREIDRGAYADVDPDDLRTVKVDARAFAKMLEAVLEEYDLLSTLAPEEWDSERQGSAPDGKWQIIVDEKFENLKIDPKQRIIQVPLKDRSLLSAIAVGSHEITHVIQHENKRMLGKLAILNNDVNFDSSSEQYEAGGVWQEQVAHGVLTGHEDTDIRGTGYFKALEVKSGGGTYGECVEAYYQDARRRDPIRSVEETASAAVKSTRRIYRAGGLAFGRDNAFITNTEPLSYLEQRFLYESLPEDQRKLLLVGGITVRNLLRLSAAGLVDTSKIFIPKKAPWEIMHPYAKDYIAATKAK